MKTISACHNLHKTYQDGAVSTTVLHGVDFALMPGEVVAIVGASGSGKSTLLHLLGGLDEASQGEVWLAEHAMHCASANQRGKLRNQYMGFVYQFHHLLPEFSALENVAMPLLIGGHSIAQAKQQARAVLVSVGLEHRLEHKPAALSGGERQRAAIARAVVTQPRCILADEPTGNLDKHNAEQVMQVLLNLNQEQGVSIIMVTHDAQLAQQAQRVLRMDDGYLMDA